MQIFPKHRIPSLSIPILPLVPNSSKATSLLLRTYSLVCPPHWECVALRGGLGKERIRSAFGKLTRQPLTQLERCTSWGRRNIEANCVEDSIHQSLSASRAEESFLFETVNDVSSGDGFDLHSIQIIEGYRPGFGGTHILAAIRWGKHCSSAPQKSSERVLVGTRRFDKKTNLEGFYNVNSEPIAIWVDVWEGLVNAEIIERVDVIPLGKRTNNRASEDKVIGENTAGIIGINAVTIIVTIVVAIVISIVAIVAIAVVSVVHIVVEAVHFHIVVIRHHWAEVATLELHESFCGIAELAIESTLGYSI